MKFQILNMRNYQSLVSMMLLCFFISCSGDESTEINPSNQTGNTDLDQEEEVIVEEAFTVEIDESDLLVLPSDNGGSHVAVKKENSNSPYSYYVYKPSGYADDGPEYPLLVFLHGWNPNLGNEPLENVLRQGPPKLIEANRWNPKFPFIVVSPQLGSSDWRPYKTHALIEHLMESYQVNRERIYLTGLSLGGGGCWYYAGEIENNYLAAMVPISASGSPHLLDNLTKIPLWAFHGGLDQTVKAYENYGSVPLVEAINQKNPKVRARLTVYSNLGHNAWSMTYDGSGLNYSSQTYDTFDMDIYEWMLAYKKSDQGP